MIGRKHALTAGLVTAAVVSTTLSLGAPAVGAQPSLLTIATEVAGPLPRTLNPFTPNDDFGITSLIYEPLIEFDLAAPPTYYPWLATKYDWTNGGKSITFTIRQGVKWSNGSPLTPADVAFTYNLVKSYPAINLGGLDISSVSTTADTVTLNFPTAQYTKLEQIAGVPIVPQSIWSTVGDPSKFVDPDPVGTGPYELSTFTSQGATLTKNPDYWQPGKPAISEVSFPFYTSNEGSLTALESGAAQWDGNFIPGLNKLFLATSPKYHHWWIPAIGTDSFIPNLTKWPTNQLAVRQAISLAIDRTTIAGEGEDGYAVPTTSATGLATPLFKDWLAPSLRSLKLNAHADPAAARAVLKAAGFVIGKDGFFQTASGKELKLTLTVPTAYTDYAEDCSLAAQELRKAGINATFVGEAANAWTSDLYEGDFQMAEYWADDGITPYALYNGWLNSALATKVASGDFERLNSAAMDADLSRLAGAETLAEQTADLAPIEKYVAAQLPVIPAFDQESFFEYNSQQFVGWPTASDPYEIGAPASTTNEVVILHLRPRS